MGDFMGWLILLAFFMPVLMGLGLSAIVFLVAVVGPFAGFGSNVPKERGISVRVHSYDEDEDR